MKQKLKNQYDAEITCPHCRKTGKFRMRGLIDTLADANAQKCVLDGSYFSWTCPQCGAVQYLSFPCIYHDGSSRLLAGCADTPKDYEEMKKQLSGTAGTRLNQALQGWLNTCKVRLVRDPGELQEKVLISILGLDDRIIELSKIQIAEACAIHPVYAAFNNTGGTWTMLFGDASGNEKTVPFAREIYDQILEAYPEALQDQSIVIDAAWAKSFLNMENNDGNQ